MVRPSRKTTSVDYASLNSGDYTVDAMSDIDEDSDADEHSDASEDEENVKPSAKKQKVTTTTTTSKKPSKTLKPSKATSSTKTPTKHVKLETDKLIEASSRSKLEKIIQDAVAATIQGTNNERVLQMRQMFCDDM
jgi:hypothetical protein